ncbi:MAG: stage II sporulation protein D [Clostridia bacterium]|nr:stage II sporulation protein D [Clostridia bacterium]
MKKYILLSILIAVITAAVPALTLFALNTDAPAEEKPISENGISGDSISVYFPEEDKTEELSFREYIIGVVAAEMPAEFHPEALSALTCAAATLARKNMETGSDESLGGAVISADHKKHQAFMTKDEMKEKWGGGFDSYYEKLCNAVDKAIDYSLTFDGELIIAAYHSMSAGMTESSENVWAKGLPYLTSVESPGDLICPRSESEITVDFDEFKTALEKEGVKLPDKKELWLSAGEYTEAGYLKEIKIGGKAFSGQELRDIFSLRSAAIKAGINSSGVVFYVKGYGHGVGLSQYGADYLARLGYSWEEILRHYYKGVEIEII